MLKKVISIFTSVVLAIGMGEVITEQFLEAKAMSGSFECVLLDDGTFEITGYIGDDTEIVIPNEIDGTKVTSIGDRAFGYSQYRGYETDEGLPITSISIPKNVKQIGDRAFYECNKLEKVTLSDGLKYIGDGAFEECESIKKIDIPDSVITIDGDAFRACSSLSEIKLSKNIKCIKKGCFSHCDSLKAITIPDGVTSISRETFTNCDNLTDVKIPNTVTAIGGDAFIGCKKLQSVNIPDSVVYIEKEAFEGTPLLDNQKDDDVKYVGKWVVDCNEDVTSVKIKDGTVGIADEAFKSCSKLEKMNIPDSVKYVGETRIEDDSPIIKNQKGDVKYIGKWVVDCNEDVTSVKIKDGTVGIASNAFKSCTNLSTIIIPDSVKYIGEHCSVENIKIPDSVQLISPYAFIYSHGLKSINIPEGIIRVEYGMFYTCKDLESVTIPDSVNSIGQRSFQDCERLEKINIPNYVTSIEDTSFLNCKNLKTITIPFSVEHIGSYAIGYNKNEDGLFEKTEGFKIKCCKGTAGEKYAIENGFDYELIEKPNIKPYKPKVTKVKPDSDNTTKNIDKATAKNIDKATAKNDSQLPKMIAVISVGLIAIICVCVVAVKKIKKNK